MCNFGEADTRAGGGIVKSFINLSFIRGIIKPRHIIERRVNNYIPGYQYKPELNIKYEKLTQTSSTIKGKSSLYLLKNWAVIKNDGNILGLIDAVDCVSKIFVESSAI